MLDSSLTATTLPENQEKKIGEPCGMLPYMNTNFGFLVIWRVFLCFVFLGAFYWFCDVPCEHWYYIKYTSNHKPQKRRALGTPQNL